MGCTAELDGDSIKLKGMYFTDGKLYFGENEGSAKEPELVAQKLAEIIREKING